MMIIIFIGTCLFNLLRHARRLSNSHLRHMPSPQFFTIPSTRNAILLCACVCTIYFLEFLWRERERDRERERNRERERQRQRQRGRKISTLSVRDPIKKNSVFAILSCHSNANTYRLSFVTTNNSGGIHGVRAVARKTGCQRWTVRHDFDNLTSAPFDCCILITTGKASACWRMRVCGMLVAQQASLLQRPRPRP